MIFRQLEVGHLQNFAYLVADEDSREAAVVDPSVEPETVLDAIDGTDLDVRWVVNTHSHSDHVMGNDAVVEATGAEIVAHEDSEIDPDVGLADGDVHRVGDVEMEAIFTPGHCPDHLCFVVDDEALISGDLLFIGECGRTDLPGGDTEQMWHSLEKIKKLPDELEVYPGHDYGPEPHRSLGVEKAENYTLEDRTLEEFKRFMREP